MANLRQNIGAKAVRKLTRSGDILIPADWAKVFLGVSRRGPFGVSDLLDIARQTEDLSHLRGWVTRPFTDVPATVIPAPFYMPDLSALWPKVSQSPLNSLHFFRSEIRKDLQHWVLEDVFFVYSRNRWVILRPDGKCGLIDPMSTALPTPECLRQIAEGQVQPVDRLCFAGDVSSTGNPGHFITDQLARAVIFRDRLGVATDAISLPMTQAPVCQVARDCVIPKVQALADGVILHVKRFEILSTVQYRGHPFWYLDPDTMAAISRPMQDLAKGQNGQGPCIYLSRRGNPRRPMVNEPALERALAAKGFTILRLEDLDGPAQLGALYHADTVVAPHGGALGSMIVMRPGTRLLELFSPRIGTLAYAGIAGAMDLRYDLMIGAKPLIGGQSGGWKMSPRAVLSRISELETS